MTRVTRRAALALVLAGCSRTPSMAVATAPFVEAHPYLVFPLTIGGRRGLALLDNGAPITGVDKVFAGGAETLPATPFGIGEARLSIEPSVDDLSELTRETENPIAAIVGMDLFKAYAVGLNFGAKTLSLFSRQGFAPPPGAVAQPLRIAARREHEIELEIDGRSARGIIDLGCSAPLLVSQAFAADRRIGKGRPETTREAMIAQGPAMVPRVSRLTSVAAVTLAGHAITDVPVSVMPDEAGAFAFHNVVVGLPLLRCFDLVFDLPGRLWTIPGPRLKAPIERRYIGLQTRPDSGGLRIRHVAANSPAEGAGLKAADLITAIDGAPPTQKALRDAVIGQTVAVQLATGKALRIKAARYY